MNMNMEPTTHTDMEHGHGTRLRCDRSPPARSALTPPQPSSSSLCRPGLVGGGDGFTLSVWVNRTRSGSDDDRIIDFGAGEDADNVLVSFQSHGEALDLT
jgi:hypothetical protein